jgi:hypothetical protein
LYICMNSRGSPSHKEGYRGERSMIFLVGFHQYSESQSVLVELLDGWMNGWMDCHVRTHFFLTRLVLGMGSWVLLSCSLLTITCAEIQHLHEFSNFIFPLFENIFPYVLLFIVELNKTQIFFIKFKNKIIYIYIYIYI